MSGEHPELDELQAAYKNSVEAWIAAIRKEEALASVNHDVADVDKWEQAHFEEDGLRNKLKAAKEDYEDALRSKFFGFYCPDSEVRIILRRPHLRISESKDTSNLLISCGFGSEVRIANSRRE